MDLVTSITDTIKSTVSPDSWRDNGGTIGSIRELNGQLIVNQSVDNQIAVYNLLQQLRETRAIQIAVEARLLLVSNNFLDDFRIGWNLSPPAAGMVGSNVTLHFPLAIRTPMPTPFRRTRACPARSPASRSCPALISARRLSITGR